MFLIITALFLGALVLVNFLYRRPFLADFKKKNVLITGTDSGFGRHLALHLDKKGLKIYAACFTSAGVENLKQAASANMCVFQMDVANVDSIARAKQLVEQDLGPNEGLFGVVNNAGISNSSIFGLTRVEDYKQVMDVNFYGSVHVNDAFGELVKKARGRIINIISMIGRFSSIAEPYTCSKFALQPYTDGLRRWMKVFGVHVAAIEPGLYQTNITSISEIDKGVDRSWHLLDETLQKQYGEEFVEKAKTDLHYWVRCCPLCSLNKIDNVIQGITHALLAKNPKDIYVIGYDANIVRLVPILPDFVMDFIINRCFQSNEFLARRIDVARASK